MSAFRKRVLGLFFGLLVLGLATPRTVLASGAYAGFNVAVHHLYQCANGTRSNCTTLRQAAEAGATIVRLDFALLPFINQQAPYAENQAAWDFLQTLLTEAASIGLRVVIDPHAMPGAARHTTLSANDRFWTDPKARAALIRMWQRLSRETKNSPAIIYGFDLINEPYNVAPGVSLNELYRDLVRAIRAIDPDRNVILDFYNQHHHDADRVPSTVKPQLPIYYDPSDLGPRGNKRGAGKIFYSTHFYWPLDYTHQGINLQRGDGLEVSKPAGQLWPDQNRQSQKTHWTATGMKNRLLGVSRFADRVGHWRIFIGEFSASACDNCAWEPRPELSGRPPANQGDKWLLNAVDIFNQQGWTWIYHSLNGSSFWDAASPRWRWNHIRYLLRR